MKSCNVCGEVKDYSEFYRDGKAIDGRRTICKFCEYIRHKDKQAEWRSLNRPRKNLKQMELYYKNKLKDIKEQLKNV